MQAVWYNEIWCHYVITVGSREVLYHTDKGDRIVWCPAIRWMGPGFNTRHWQEYTTLQEKSTSEHLFWCSRLSQRVPGRLSQIGLSRVVDYSAKSRIALIFEYKFHTRLIAIFKRRGVQQDRPVDPYAY